MGTWGEFGATDVGQIRLNVLEEEMVRPERFELPTTWFEARYSIQLSYGR